MYTACRDIFAAGSAINTTRFVWQHCCTSSANVCCLIEFGCPYSDPQVLSLPRSALSSPVTRTDVGGYIYRKMMVLGMPVSMQQYKFQLPITDYANSIGERLVRKSTCTKVSTLGQYEKLVHCIKLEKKVGV